MTKRFVLEAERPQDEIGVASLVACIALPALACGIAGLVKSHAPAVEIAGTLVAAGAVAAWTSYLADQQSRVVLTLGDDGLTLQGNRQPTILVSHGAITSVESHDKGFVEVERADGATIVFRARAKPPFRSRRQRAGKVVAAIVQAREVFRSWHDKLTDEPLFDPCGRTAAQLVTDLKSLTKDKVVTYRSTPFDRDRYMHIAENPAAPAHDRVSAFIALRADATDDDSLRMRNALDRVADENVASRLRVAMQSDDEAELVRALSLVEDDEGPISLPQRLRRRRAI